MLNRRIIALLFGMAVSVAWLPGAVHAQQPDAATEIKIFVPISPDGTLNPALSVRSRDSFPPPFTCQAGSITTQRPDAWRCGTDDPCFSPAFADPSAPNPVLTCAIA